MVNLFGGLHQPPLQPVEANHAGPGAAASITIKASPILTGVNTLTVSLVAPTGGLSTITTPSSQVLNLANNLTGIIYVVNYVAGCAGATPIAAS